MIFFIDIIGNICKFFHASNDAYYIFFVNYSQFL